MKKSLSIGACAVLSLLSVQSKAWAWGDIGHGTVGYIAEENLSKKGKALVRDLIGMEPLGIAATFPDHVRDEPIYAPFAAFHFLDAGSVELRDANTIISQVPALIAGSSITKQQKAVLLRYLVHVVGDVHQPLHVGNGFDMGANLCTIRWQSPMTGKVVEENLHKYWDNSVMDDIQLDIARRTHTKKNPFFGYRDLGKVILTEFQKNGQAQSLAAEVQLPPAKWYEESTALHTAGVYPDSSPTKPEERPYCKRVDASGKVVNGAFNPSSIPTLGPDYVQKAMPIVKERIYLGGQRLAVMINQIAEKMSLSDWPEDGDRKFIDGILLQNSGAGREPSSTKATKNATGHMKKLIELHNEN